MKFHGSCHCGNLSFVLDWDPDPVEIPVRACDCTFCVKHGGAWTGTPRGRLTVRVEAPGNTSTYAFGTGTARFHVCARCGVVPVVTSEIEQHTYAVVSAHALDDVDPAMFRRSPVCFDGESAEARLARRAQAWIPDVRFEIAEA